MSFFSNLFDEIRAQGKILVPYILTQLPSVTSFPGLGTAARTALMDRTPAAYIDLSIQVLMAAAAAIKTKKIVVDAVAKS